MYWTLELASYLEDAPWPATKDELIDYSIRSGAPMEVVENLQALEDDGQPYENIEEIYGGLNGIWGILREDLIDLNDEKAKAIELFRDLALPDPERIGQRYPHQVSGGQLQRVMAAMALISDPLLVVLDEPNANLDDAGEKALIEVLEDLKQRHCTTVLISHRPSILGTVDKVLMLREGSTQLFGPREEVFAALRQTSVLPTVGAPTLSAVRGRE